MPLHLRLLDRSPQRKLKDHWGLQSQSVDLHRHLSLSLKNQQHLTGHHQSGSAGRSVGGRLWDEGGIPTLSSEGCPFKTLKWWVEPGSGFLEAVSWRHKRTQQGQPNTFCPLRPRPNSTHFYLKGHFVSSPQKFISAVHYMPQKLPNSGIKDTLGAKSCRIYFISDSGFINNAELYIISIVCIHIQMKEYLAGKNLFPSSYLYLQHLGKSLK